MSTTRFQELLGLLGQNSCNFHWPSSRHKRKHKQRTHSQRRSSDNAPGGQEGHPGKTLEMQEDPDEIVLQRPETCPHCQTTFPPNQAAVAVAQRQVYDLLPFHMLVTGHQADTLRRTACGELSHGAFPETAVAPVQYAPRVQQLATYLCTAQFLPV